MEKGKNHMARGGKVLWLGKDHIQAIDLQPTAVLIQENNHS